MDTNDLRVDSFDQTQANEEGWCISQCSGSMHIPEDFYEIQACMSFEDEVFESDMDAMCFVFSKIAEGSEYHANAFYAMENSNYALVRALQSRVR